MNGHKEGQWEHCPNAVGQVRLPQVTFCAWEKECIVSLVMEKRSRTVIGFCHSWCSASV